MGHKVNYTDLYTPSGNKWVSYSEVVGMNPAPAVLNYNSTYDLYSIKVKEEQDVSPKIVIAKLCIGCKLPMCESCNVCEEAECVLVGKCIISRGEMISLGLASARTQKATGFMQLKGKFGLNIPSPFHIIMEEGDINFVKEFDAFLRPCPVRPRHGFVESRRMPSTLENLRQVWAETIAADPNGEMIVCQAIDAKYNAIFTPSMLAVGPGHAGATGGSESVSLPLMGVLMPELVGKEALLKAGVDLDIHDPYLELVCNSNNSKWVYTQLRAGAKVPKAPDYVPERMVVDRVLEASGDLMEWEKQVAGITRGTVVHHLGGTLISHYGVHCLTNHIPIFTTRVPVIGEVLEPIGEVVQHEPWQMIRGLALGTMIPTKFEEGSGIGIRQLLPLMMTVLHNSPAMGNGWGVWVGFAASIMMRAGMAASHGEARHADFRVKSKYNRGMIYETAFQDFWGARETLGAAQWAFLYHRWESKSFGGKAWASCTESIILLDKAARELITNPTEDARIAVVNALNRAVNEAHNGGWWLNKFLDQSFFDSASTQSKNALERVASVLIPVNDFFKTVEEFDWKGVAERWGALGEINIAPRDGNTAIKTIDEDGDIVEDYEGDDPPEPEEDYDKSFGINPNCCKDCKGQYAEQVAAFKPSNQNKVEPQPISAEPPTVLKKTPSVGGAKKVEHHTGQMIEKAHIRFQWDGTRFNYHMQCLVGNSLKGNKIYTSYDEYINPTNSAKMSQNMPGNIHNLFEGSYSSDAGGYLPLLITDMDTKHVFVEPISGLVLSLDKSGKVGVSNVLEKGIDSNGQAEAEESKTEESSVSI